jgi:hypothetical protein
VASQIEGRDKRANPSSFMTLLREATLASSAALKPALAAAACDVCMGARRTMFSRAWRRSVLTSVTPSVTVAPPRKRTDCLSLRQSSADGAVVCFRKYKLSAPRVLRRRHSSSIIKNTCLMRYFGCPINRASSLSME